MFKYRTANHKLPIETGRYQNIEYKDRTCPRCLNDIGDEFHYLLKCPVFSKERKKYISQNLTRHPNMITYKNIMMSKDTMMLAKVCNFIRIIMQNIKY